MIAFWSCYWEGRVSGPWRCPWYKSKGKVTGEGTEAGQVTHYPKQFVWFSDLPNPGTHTSSHLGQGLFCAKLLGPFLSSGFGSNCNLRRTTQTEGWAPSPSPSCLFSLFPVPPPASGFQSRTSRVLICVCLQSDVWHLFGSAQSCPWPGAFLLSCFSERSEGWFQLPWKD